MTSIEIACIGAAHVDRRAHTLGPVVPGSSNPVTVATSAGGVARNVTETLARLGAAVRLVSRVGSDAEGDRLLADLARLGVDLTGVRRADVPTASYTALLDPDGQLAIGLADMAIYDSMDAAFFAPLLPGLATAPVWFIDANVAESGLRHLLADRPARGFVAGDTVSVAKAPRLLPLLDRIDLLFCNGAEAAALLGSDSDPTVMAKRLLEQGAGAVIVTLGAAGAVLASSEGVVSLPAIPAPVRDVTGAGDALVAATLLRRAQGASLLAAVRAGLGLAALTAASDRAVRPDLSPALLEDALAEGAA
jgi:pseudouridine kinase